MARVPTPAAERLKQFFANNPNEWLSIEDVMQKFGLKEYNARHALGECTNCGVAERISVYRTKPVSSTVSDQVSAEVSK